ncbi:DUF3224 domain-containing protein [Rheinheimera sp.]|uniref:DUF3224 domain-containing protein n=1 Tax=Rheinheimera sp. TaxID=1869214 RepID=UPI00307E3E07
MAFRLFCSRVSILFFSFTPHILPNQGKKRSFVLQHFGTINKGQSTLLLEVVPDSGAGELTGLRGKMQIKVENGKHFYEFDYEIAAV